MLELHNVIYYFWIILSSVCFVIPIIGFSIASIVIASVHFDADCDGIFMPLPVWLISNAILSLIFLCIEFIILFVFALTKKLWLFLIFMISLACDNLFVICWNIIGSIALFRDGGECQNASEPLWIMSIIIFMFQWVTLCNSCAYVQINYKKNATPITMADIYASISTDT